jgi:hypothetical protein
VKLPLYTVVQEWKELSRFQSLDPGLRSVVFYAEDGGSWVHFSDMVDALVNDHGQPICYVTSSRDDPVLDLGNDRVRTYCVGFGSARTRLFRSLQAQVMVMTMPDLETFHIKRSRYPVHYVYVHHSMISTHMSYRPAAFDNFDSVLCAGRYHEEEIRARETLHGLRRKMLVQHGYGRLDAILKTTRSCANDSGSKKKADIRVAIAPSWGRYSLLETCGAELIEVLLEAGLTVVVRPHPVTIGKSPKLIAALTRKFDTSPQLEFDFDVASQETLETSDIMVSDWSGVALEFAFGLERPVLLVDVPRKVNNPDYQELDIEPIEAQIRPLIGAIISPDNLAEAPEAIERLIENKDEFPQRVRSLRDQTIHNVGSSGAAAAEYIAGLVREHKTLD